MQSVITDYKIKTNKAKYTNICKPCKIHEISRRVLYTRKLIHVDKTTYKGNNMTKAQGKASPAAFSTNTNVARFINHGHAKTGKAVIRIKILNQPGTSRDDFSFSIL